VLLPNEFAITHLKQKAPDDSLLRVIGRIISDKRPGLHQDCVYLVNPIIASQTEMSTLYLMTNAGVRGAPKRLSFNILEHAFYFVKG